MRRLILIGIALALALGLTSTVSRAGNDGERLINASFEEGFADNGVALGWTAFNNGGTTEYVYHDDTGPRFSADGKHSQFLRIRTLDTSEPERYSGIYQTVAVTAGSAYTLTISGMLRILPEDTDRNNYSYMVQWGVDLNGGTDWGQVAFNDLPWNTTYNEDDTGALGKFTTSLTATSNKLTVFVRALKKWPTRYRTLFANFDTISLVGAVPPITTLGSPVLDMTPPDMVYTTKPFHVRITAADEAGVTSIRLLDNNQVVATATHTVPPLARDVDFVWTPAVAGAHTLQVEATNGAGKTTMLVTSVPVAPIAEFLKNGDFEGGFAPSGVANNWGWFNNGGQNVIYPIMDDTWPPVLGGGKHSQMVGISTVGWNEGDPNSEPDRYAGICQVVTGLSPNGAYYLTANGMLRITASDKHTDDWSWSAQWGYAKGASSDCSGWQSVTNWQTIPWSHADFRDAPSTINSYQTVFTSPSDTLTLYLRTWKKWAIGDREFLVNFDNVSLAGHKSSTGK